MPLSRPPPEGTFVFLSELLGRPALGPSGARLGSVVDLLADASEPAYPKVTALRVRVSLRGEVRRVEWEDVALCGPDATRLKREAEALQPLKLLGNEIPLAQDVLDRQIVDTDDAKVERVNDLHLVTARGELRVAHVDVGFRGLVRRMGWQRTVDALLRAVRPGAAYLRKEQFVPWKHVQPLAAGTSRVELGWGTAEFDRQPGRVVAALGQPARSRAGRLPWPAARGRPRRSSGRSASAGPRGRGARRPRRSRGS